MSHTKGPWYAEDNSVIAEDGSHIATVNTIHDFPCIEEDNTPEQLAQIEAECKGDVLLIAAAPDLLAACKAVQEAVKDSIATKTSMNNMKYDAVGQQLVKAIQKAEGAQ